MSKFESTISGGSDCHVTLFHDPEDPSTWIVRKWKRQLFWKRYELSRWFATRQQAEAFAADLVEQCGKTARLRA